MMKYEIVIDECVHELQVSQIKKHPSKRLYHIRCKFKEFYTFSTEKQIIDYFAMIRGYLSDDQLKGFTIEYIPKSNIINQGDEQLYVIHFDNTSKYITMNNNQVKIPNEIKNINLLQYVDKITPYDQLYVLYYKP